MIEFNFKSQIATTIEQSERLIALGLRKETADMVHYRLSSMNAWGILAMPWRNDCEGRKCYYPAWSLNRLIELKQPNTIDNAVVVLSREQTYDKLIEMIAKSIKGGKFPKEYLKK